jgi:hypothetical protein
MAGEDPGDPGVAPPVRRRWSGDRASWAPAGGSDGQAMIRTERRSVLDRKAVTSVPPEDGA